LDKTPQGVLKALGVVTLLTLLLLPAAISIPAPSSDLLGDIANIGVVLVLAYVVEAVGLVPRMTAEGDNYDDSIGLMTGLAAAGMVGIVFAVALSAHRAAGHANLLDDLGFAWIVASLTILAGIVTIHPLIVDSWERPKQRPGYSAQKDV
jgi:hypothetical protein